MLHVCVQMTSSQCLALVSVTLLVPVKLASSRLQAQHVGSVHHHYGLLVLGPGQHHDYLLKAVVKLAQLSARQCQTPGPGLKLAPG